jgi:hypothetical protein
MPDDMIAILVKSQVQKVLKRLFVREKQKNGRKQVPDALGLRFGEAVDLFKHRLIPSVNARR